MSKYQANRQRARARRCAVQALYQWQLAGQQPSSIVEEFVAERELINVDQEYFRELTTEVPKHGDVLREQLEGVLDRDWAQLDPVEAAVLWIGAYEFKHREDIPWRVVVNEGVELCKMFGAEDGFKYVNGVLDRLAESLRPVEVSRST